MRMLTLLLVVPAMLGALQRSGPIPADEVTLRRQIYKDSRATVFLLDIGFWSKACERESTDVNS
jgi:hypothetical protein